MSGDMLIEFFYEELDEKHCTIFFSDQPYVCMKPHWTRGMRRSMPSAMI